MAVSPGKDYAIIRKCDWFFETGMGSCTALFTRPYLFVFPHDAFKHTGRTMHETKYSIQGRHPADAISDLVADPETTPESMVDALQKWSSEVKGPIVDPMEDYKRVKLFTGFIRRSVVLSKKDSGYDISPVGLRPKKEELPALVDFFREHPGAIIK